MDIGVFHLVGVVHRFDHDARFLRARAVVEIDQGLAVHLARQDREVGANLRDVIHGQTFGTAVTIPSDVRMIARIVTMKKKLAIMPKSTFSGF